MSLHQNEEYRSPIFHDFDQSEIVIVKRNNKKDTFQPEKIAVAIKKGFDSITNSDYSAADSHFVFLKVMEQIEVQVKESPQIAIEEIQDIIEKQLLKQGYDDVYESFSQYRLRRNESRRVFFFF